MLLIVLLPLIITKLGVKLCCENTKMQSIHCKKFFFTSNEAEKLFSTKVKYQKPNQYRHRAEINSNSDSQYKNDMLNKIADKMFHMLAICTILYPCRIDEALEQQMKEKITFDKLTKMQGKLPYYLSNTFPNEKFRRRCKDFRRSVQFLLPKIRFTNPTTNSSTTYKHTSRTNCPTVACF